MPRPNITGKPRVPVREIPCADCTCIFGQTAYEMKRNRRTCPDCLRKYKAEAPRKSSRKKEDRSLYETVLPRSMVPHFDRKREEWYMKVRTRRRNSGEELVMEKVWLGVTGRDADPMKVNEAFTAAYARMQLRGCSSKPIEKIRKHRKKIQQIRRDLKSWRQGIDRDLGIERKVVQKVYFKVHLPDPVIDGKKHYVGRYDTRAEARKARDAKYKELQHIHLPCAVCGVLPSLRRGNLTHFSTDCPNNVQMPTGIRGLMQSKLWNLVFRFGKVKAGKITQEDLCNMGYLRKPHKGFRFYARTDVEYKFSLAAGYAKTPAPIEEDPVFE